MPGTPTDDTRTQPIGFACPVWLIAKLRAAAKKEGVSLSAFIRRALEAYLSAGQGNGKPDIPDPKIWW